MKQPTYQQISDLYHELWELQHKLDEAESERDLLKEQCKQESEYTEVLVGIIWRARDALDIDNTELAMEELNKV